mmetsp:Transcript_23101/g.87384  ORF Transcript_23101/g.87384 Transcript_23101/m.87384 type:complete len:214 (+) Transcript_23101:415-1056(+)
MTSRHWPPRKSRRPKAGSRRSGLATSCTSRSMTGPGQRASGPATRTSGQAHSWCTCRGGPRQPGLSSRPTSLRRQAAARGALRTFGAWPGATWGAARTRQWRRSLRAKTGVPPLASVTSSTRVLCAATGTWAWSWTSEQCPSPRSLPGATLTARSKPTQTWPTSSRARPWQPGWQAARPAMHRSRAQAQAPPQPLQRKRPPTSGTWSSLQCHQ